MNSKQIRVVGLVVVGVVLAYAVAEVVLRPSLPDVSPAPTPAEVSRAEELDRRYRESAFWARVRMRRQADLLRDELAKQEAGIQRPSN